MPVIQLHDEQHPLKRGETRLGGGPDADVSVSDDASLGVQALLEVGADDQAVLRRADTGSQVRVNGVPLGAEPAPLMHGDKLVIGGVDLFYSDDRRDGATRHVAASESAAMAAKRAGPARATTSAGGRLVSLVDGKEYVIADTGLVIGRDAGSDVVVAQSEVSRRHCGIAPADGGYRLVDDSTNGVFVNGERVEGSRVLARADVIRVGGEEFRFYADMAPVAPVVATVAPSAPVRRPTPAPLLVEGPTLPTQALLSPSVPRATRAVDRRPILAELELLNEGLTKGLRIEIRGALSHIGRGEHNDVVLAHDSVSDSHAKLQRREDGWYLVDMDSTNGTFVGGVRLAGERRLDGSPDLRFGGVKTRFHSTAGVVDPAPTTRQVSATSSPRPVSPPPAERASVPRWVWILLALVVVAGAIYFLKA
ncbi:MAG: FHA domain-containing protein [Gemmatimonadaceae bacterium]